jgi:hypothetical protein
MARIIEGLIMLPMPVAIIRVDEGCFCLFAHPAEQQHYGIDSGPQRIGDAVRVDHSRQRITGL